MIRLTQSRILLSDFKQGTVVLHNETRDYGHVVGFDRAYYDSGFLTILKVLWDDGEVRSIHPANVTIA